MSEMQIYIENRWIFNYQTEIELFLAVNQILCMIYIILYSTIIYCIGSNEFSANRLNLCTIQANMIRLPVVINSNKNDEQRKRKINVQRLIFEIQIKRPNAVRTKCEWNNFCPVFPFFFLTTDTITDLNCSRPDFAFSMF